MTDTGIARASQVGEKMPDGTVFAVISPNTGKAMYTTQADAPLTYTFREAQRYGGRLNADRHHGHTDWKAPDKDELNVLFHNRAAIGGFNDTGSDPASSYWSRSEECYFGEDDHYYDSNAWAQRFSDGSQNLYNKITTASVRFVRG